MKIFLLLTIVIVSILAVASSVYGTDLSDADFQTLRDNADNSWKGYFCKWIDTDTRCMYDWIFDNWNTAPFKSGIMKKFTEITPLLESKLQYTSDLDDNLPDHDDHADLLVAYVYSLKDHMFSTQVYHDDGLVVIVDNYPNSEKSEDLRDDYNVDDWFKNPQDLVITFRKGWQVVYFYVNQGRGNHYLYLDPILSSDENIAIFEGDVSLMGIKTETIETNIINSHPELKCLLKPDASCVQQSCTTSNGEKGDIIQSKIFPSEMVTETGCCKPGQCTWTGNQCYSYGDVLNTFICADNNDWYTCTKEIQDYSGMQVENVNEKLLTCLPDGWKECGFNTVYGQNQEFFCNDKHQIIPNIPGTSCNSKDNLQVIVWSYNLPSEQKYFEDKVVPGAVACCKPGQCASKGGKCTEFDQVVSKVYSCGNDNNWDFCDSKSNINTLSDSGNYFCNGVSWIKTENCTNGINDNDDKKIDCSDPQCNDRIGAEFNQSGCTDPAGCTCNSPKETICNDGFNNDLWMDSLNIPSSGCDKDKINECNQTCDQTYQNCYAQSTGLEALGCLLVKSACVLGCNAECISYVGTDCFDTNCREIKSIGPQGGQCCNTVAPGAICGPDKELHETKCNDNEDNDGDGLTDCDDPECGEVNGCLCNDGIDNNKNTLIDCADSGCAGYLGLNGELCQLYELSCNDGFDNNGNNKTDCADPDCWDRLSKSTCMDSDGGKKVFDYGWVYNLGNDENQWITELTTILRDTCKDRNTLNEAICDASGRPTYTEKICPLKGDCQSGKCEGTSCGEGCLRINGEDRETNCNDERNNDEDYIYGGGVDDETTKVYLTDCKDPDCRDDPSCNKVSLKKVASPTEEIFDSSDYLCEAKETFCADGQDNDGDLFTDCLDSDCNNARCGGTALDPQACYNFKCQSLPKAGFAPVRIIANITFTTYSDLLNFLHQGKVIQTTEPNSCNQICSAEGLVCGFAQGGRSTCSETESTKCTCYSSSSAESSSEEATPIKEEIPTNLLSE